MINIKPILSALTDKNGKLCTKCMGVTGTFGYITYLLLEQPDRIFCFNAQEAAFAILMIYGILEYMQPKN